MNINNNNHNDSFSFFSILCFLCLLSPALLAQTNLLDSAKQHHQVQPGETPQGLTSTEWGNIQQQINSAKYLAYADENGGYRSANPAQGWQIQYAVDGTTTLTPRNNQATPFYLGMKLSAIGYQKLQALHNPQKISQQDDTVSYQWNDDMHERWINSEQQLEQWFDIARRPKGAGQGHPLTVQITLDSELNITQNGNSVQFTDQKGTRITYNKLKVWDSTGRELPARMQLVSNTLNLLVDDSIAQYPVTIDPIVSMPSFQQQAYLKASNTDAEDLFGFSVAISGDTLVVGAVGEASNSTGVNGDEGDNSLRYAGAAYVFTRNNSTWTQQAYLKASNPDSDDLFGYSVAISGDTLVVGAIGERSNSTGVNGDEGDNSLGGSAGSAYVFTRSDSTWTQQAYLKASNTDIDQFGWSVAISGDTLVVGAKDEASNSTGVNGDESDNSLGSAGAAYVYTRSDSTWTQQAYLKASNTDARDRFGWSVAISGDTLVVGAIYEASNSTGVNGDESDNSLGSAGAAYVYTRSDSTWTQQAYLKASNPGSGDQFGYSVAISGDTLVVASIGEASNSTGVNGDESDNSLASAGAAYVYTRSDSTWTQQAYLKTSNPDSGALFGWSVAISGDTLVVGAIHEASISTEVNGDESDGSLARAGVAYVYTRSDATWTQQAYLNASNTDSSDEFGYSVAISGDTLVVGAIAEASNSTGVNGDESDNSNLSAGAAYVYEFIQQSLTISKTGTGSGNVSSTPEGIDCGNDCSELYHENTEITLTAIADPGSKFTGWSDADCSGTDTCIVTMDVAKTVAANFDLNIIVETLWIPIDTGADDAEENVANGDMSLTSSDLEMDLDGLEHQKVGLRFALDIPAGATILNATIQFTADEIGSKPTTLSISAEATANALPFSNTAFNISNRTLITKTAMWQPFPWETKGEAGPDQQTPDLSSIIQAVVNQGAWAQGNAIAFIITGNGRRVAESYSGTAAPVLHVEFSTIAALPYAVDDGSDNTPEYLTGINQTLTVTNGVDDIVEHNDTVGYPAAEISSFGPDTGTETRASNMGMTALGGELVVKANGSFSYTPPTDFKGVDSFVYTLTNPVGSDTATVFIGIQELKPLWVAVATGSDDAEEKVSSGLMSLTSSDLELIRDGLSEQWVGVRFLGLNIPQGTIIADARIQFTANESTTETTELTVYGEDNANSSTFSNIPFDISDRLLTTTMASWMPLPWNTNEPTSSTQATPNLAGIVQEIVNRADWEAGGPIVFIISGTGKRVAESYNGTAAPVLHVSFLAEPPTPDAIDDGTPEAPAYIASVNQTLTVDNGEDDIVERNDSVGFPIAAVSEFDAASAQGGTVIVNADGGFSYTPPTNFVGDDSFGYTLTNSAGSDSATVYIEVVGKAEIIPLWIPVITKSDDAEQDVTSGEIDLGSSDLEMIRDQLSTQLVGVRFQGLAVPPGAVIERARIQFTTDERTTEQTVLSIVAEANANAPTFRSTGFDISNRTPSMIQVEWRPQKWIIKGVAGSEQSTPDLAAIVQAVVDLDDWEQGNPIVFMISGIGNRVAESFDGTAAPVLHLEYSIPAVVGAVDR